MFPTTYLTKNKLSFQNAHCPPGLPQFDPLLRPLTGRTYRPRSCWLDVHRAIMEARFE